MYVHVDACMFARARARVCVCVCVCESVCAEEIISLKK